MLTFEEQQKKNLQNYVLNYPNDKASAQRLSGWNQSGKDPGATNIVTLSSNKQPVQGTMSQPQQQQTSPYDDIWEQYRKNVMNTASNASSLAQNQASRMANQQRNQINSGLQSAQSNYNSGLKQVDTAMADAKQRQEETSFQQYLASRQQIANSGLSGQGLAKDEDVRLQLANQRNIAGIERDAANQRYKLQEDLNNRTTELNNQLGTINEGDLYNELFARYNAQEMQNRTMQAQNIQGMYDMMRLQEQDEYSRQLDSRDFAIKEADVTGMYNGQPTMNMANTLYEREQSAKKAEADAQQSMIDQLWKVSESTGYIHPELSDMYGIPRGTTTLEVQKMLLDQQYKQDQSAQGWAGIEINQQRANNDMYQFNTKLENDNYWKEAELNKQVPLSSSQLTGFMNSLSKKHLEYDNYSKSYAMPTDKAKKQKAEDGIYKDILSLGLPDNQTLTLLSMYGLQNRVNFNSSSGGGGRKLGSLSAKYESNGNPGTIANNAGDPGGKSYGTYQFAMNTGSLTSFVNSLKATAPTIYNTLSKHKLGSSGFDSAWKQVSKNPSFGQLQHNYIQQNYYEPAKTNISKTLGIDLSNRSEAIQNVLWSTSVQHGIVGATRVFKNAGITNKMSDAEIIKRIYQERAANNGKKYFPSSSDGIRKSVVNRFAKEMNDALKMLG